MSGEKGGVPEGWREVKLGDVLQVLKDGTHFSPQEFLDEGRKYITSKNIRFGYMDLSDIQYVSEEVHAKIYKGSPVKKGDVLLTKDGANTGNVAINNLEEEFSLLSSVAILRGRGDSLQNEYLFQHLMSPKTQNFIQGDMAGQAITRLTLQKIGRFPILLPPLPEQRKIAAILSTWDDSIATLTNLLVAKRQQKRGLAEALLTGKKRLKGFEGEWEEKKLGEVAEFLGRGKAPSYVEEKANVFAVNQKCIRDGRVNLDFVRPHDADKRIPAEVKLRYGDICVNSTGTGTAGRVGLFALDNSNGNAPGIPSKNAQTVRRVGQTGGTLWESSAKSGRPRSRRKSSWPFSVARSPSQNWLVSMGSLKA